MREKAKNIYRQIQSAFEQIVQEHGLDTGETVVTCKALSPEEAIGITERKDYPILTGKEVMLLSTYKGASGQAFTDAPCASVCSLGEILALDICQDDNYARGLYISTMNAVMRYLGLIDNTVHCRSKEPPQCAQEYVPWLKEHYPAVRRLALIGYQPALFGAFSAEPSIELRVLDLNPDNVGEIRFGHRVEHGIDDYEDAVLHWADLVLCTSSVFCNATMDLYIDIGREVLFFGITGAGPIHVLGLNRHCPLSTGVYNW